jgi:acetyl-CoA synthetase
MEKHHIAKYQDLIRKSTKNIDRYWDAVNKDLSLNWFKDYSYVVDSSKGVEKSKWFVDGKCNIISNAIDRHLNESADKLAFIFENEKGEVRSFTYAEIDYHISALALALKSHGIAKGDIVGIYLPVIPEAIFSILACSKIGVVHNTIFSGHGEEALASRLNESRAKLLITVNEMERKGSKINLKKNWLFALGREELRGIIVVDQNENNTESQKVVGYDNFVSKFLGHDCKTEVMNSEDPLFILYTSGTTGKPKAVIHTHGGFMIVSAQQACYVIDMKKEDILFWYADIGWITGQTWTIYGSTIAGSTSVLYDGMLTYPVPDQWCKVIQKYNVSIFGASPTAIRLFMRDNNNFNYIDSYDFHSLRILATTGEPINKEAWIWYYNNVGKGEIPLINLSGGTEIGGAILSTTFLECMKPCSVGFPIPGFDASVFDDGGNETKNGILVIKKPWPSMTRGLVNDYDKFIKDYWSRYKNTWFHGDTVEIDSDGYWYITGRIDDVIKVSGHRLGSNEIENILMSNELVSEAIAVGIPDDIKGEAIACFIIPKKESINEKLLSSVLVSLLEKKIGKYARPKYIRFVKDLPRTKSGKLVRRLVRLMILKMEIPDKDLLLIDNPESVRNTSINSSSKIQFWH